MKERLAIAVGALIPTVWSVGAFLGSFTSDYTIFQVTTPLMLGEAGWLFGLAFFKNGTKVNGAKNGA